MNDNFRFCLQLSRCAYILLTFIWPFLSRVWYSWTFPTLLFVGYLLVYLLCSFFGSNLDGVDRLNSTQILDRCLNNYKIGLGYITLCGVAPLVPFLDSEMDSMISSLCLHVSTLAVQVVLEIIIQPTLIHCDLDSTSLRSVADNMKTAFLVFLFALLTLLFLRVFGLWPNTFTNLMFQIVWVSANFPYYIEFWKVMTESPNLRLVRNEEEEVMDRFRRLMNVPRSRAVLDDSDSSDDSESAPDEQHPSIPTKIVISSEDLECNVCLLQFSEKRVPLVLTKCGHSLCKKCCKTAQRQLPLSRFISCPFCRAQTPGPIAMLPKNYTVMGIVQKIGQQVIRE